MIYTVNINGLIDRINPIAFAKYLNDTGWELYPTKRQQIVKVYQVTKSNGDKAQVNIPMTRELSDYSKAMLDAVEIVADVENQSPEKLMLFLLNPNTDIIKIRVDRKDVEAGNILIDDAIKVYDSAKKLISAAAQDVINPKMYHQGRPADDINNFVNGCRFGQTEIGSYVISVVCPFAELDDVEGYRQLSLFSDEEKCANSLTRLVTKKIMDNVTAIKSSIDEGNIDKLLLENKEARISTNFFEALSGLGMDKADSNLELIAQWSPAVKINRSVNDRVVITNDYYEPIANTISRLKESKNKKTRVFGRVKALRSAPDLQKRESGRVSVVYLDENDKPKTVTTILDKEDYEKAIEAHSKGLHVEIIGDMTGSRQKSHNIICDSFSIID